MTAHRHYAFLWIRPAIDAAIISLCLLAAFLLAVQGIPRPLSHGVPELAHYLKTLPLILGTYLYTALFFRFYRPRRTASYGRLAFDLVKVNLQSALIILALFFYYREVSYSRLIFTNFFVLNPILVFFHHVGWMAWERRRHRRGIGTHSCLVVGTGELAQSIARRFQEHPWTGLSIRGFVTVEEENTSPRVDPNQILGSVTELGSIIANENIQEVIVAVPFRVMHVLPNIDKLLAQSMVGLRWAPDLEALNTLWREVTDFDGLPLINLRGSKIHHGLNAFMKRSVDLGVSLSLLAFLAPILALISGVIRLRYGSPVLFRQERVGLDGQVFTLYKFRTMQPNAEEETGPVWATANDQRCTRMGAFLRATSLDELPQLWNVLLGQMSLVGPRPERPVFIEEFKRTVPRYMLRHRMKAGLTGWAQVNGWRGNTSLHKRIQFDLYYLRNWNIWFDLKILFLTLFRGWGRRRNAH